MALIDPADFPTINTSMIEPAEDALKKWGANLLADVESLRSEWRKLWGCYFAPEQERVYALQDPAVEGAREVKADFDAAAHSLGLYASALDAIKPELDRLRSDAEAFRTEALQGYQPSEAAESGDAVLAWQDHGPAVARNNELLARLDAILGRITEAETDCADGLLGIAGAAAGLSYAAIATQTPAAAVNPVSGGQPMPWGQVGSHRSSQCADSDYWASEEFVAPAALVAARPGGQWAAESLANPLGGLINVVFCLAYVAAAPGPALAGDEDRFPARASDRDLDAGTFLGGLVGLGQMGGASEPAPFEDYWTAGPDEQEATPTSSVLSLASLLVPINSASAAVRSAGASRMLRLADAVGLGTRMGAALGTRAHLLSGDLRPVQADDGANPTGLEAMLNIPDDSPTSWPSDPWSGKRQPSRS